MDFDTKHYFLDNKLHRIDGPAIEKAGADEYYLRGKKVSKSDIEDIDYKEEIENFNNIDYILDGQLHRLDGPAVEYTNGDKYWYQNGEGHRLDGPAYEFASGIKIWYKNGKLHRLDGPAVEFCGGNKQYWIEGKQIIDQIEIDRINTIKKEFENIVEYRLDGKLHRVDGPAKEYKDDSKYWYQNGNLHRTDGPAAEYSNGTKYWYQNGKSHRTDGPAVELTSGTKEYWIEGKRITDQSEIDRINTVKTEFNNRVEYLLDGKLHKTDGPAVEYSDGSKAWYQNGNLHRTDGPAIEYSDGDKFWYLNGELYQADGPAINTSWSHEDPVVSEIKETAFRVASIQLNKTIRQLILNKFKLDIPAEFIAALLGCSLSYHPNQNLQKIAEEPRIEAIAGIGESLINSLITEVIDQLKPANAEICKSSLNTSSLPETEMFDELQIEPAKAML